MKEKFYSWLLAGAYVAWGVCLLLLIRRFQPAFVGFNIPVPFLMKIMFVTGPYGCLLITAVIGAMAVLNSRRFHVRFMGLILTITLLAWAGYVTNALCTALTRQIA